MQTGFRPGAKRGAFWGKMRHITTSINMTENCLYKNVTHYFALPPTNEYLVLTNGTLTGYLSSLCYYNGVKYDGAGVLFFGGRLGL